MNKVFQITGEKIATFIADADTLKFSSSTSYSVDGFQQKFSKQLSFATKHEVKYESIKSISKEDGDKDVLIKYKGFAGLPSEIQFSFQDPDDCEIFFSFLVKDRYFTKMHKTLKPFRAIRNYLIGLLATIAATVFLYFLAIDIANGKAVKARDGKTIIFNYVLSLLGDKGVIIVGVVISFFLLRKILVRYKNPPNQLKLIPPLSS